MTEDITEINCLGLKCPLPVLRLKKALKAGQTHLRLIADDPVSVVDIPLAAYEYHAQIYTHKRHDGAYEFEIKLNSA